MLVDQRMRRVCPPQSSICYIKLISGSNNVEELQFPSVISQMDQIFAMENSRVSVAYWE